MLNTDYQSQVSQGFTAMVLIMMTMTLTWLFAGLATDTMGEQIREDGVQRIIQGYTIFFGFDILMAFLVRIIDHRVFRWFTVVGVTAWTAYFSYLVFVADPAAYIDQGWHMITLGTIRNFVGYYTIYAALRWALPLNENAPAKPVAAQPFPTRKG